MKYIVHGARNRLESNNHLLSMEYIIVMKRLQCFDPLPMLLGHVMLSCNLTKIVAEGSSCRCRVAASLYP